MDPVTVGQTTNQWAVNVATQRKVFFAAGRHWIVYADGVNFVARSSVDLVMWDEEAIRAGGVQGSAFAVHYDGAYLHYACTDAAGDLFYRRGTPNADGTITWSALEQTVHSIAGEDCSFPSITVDTAGHAWIGYMITDTNVGEVFPNGTPYAVLNDNIDGTWATAAGFPFQLNAVVEDGWRAIPVALTAQRVYIVYDYTDFLAYKSVQGILYNGGWGAIENATSALRVTNSLFSATSEEDDVLLVVSHQPATLIEEIIFNRRTWGVGWGVEEVLDTLVTWARTLTVSVENNGVIYVFWCDEDTIHFIAYQVGAWWGESVVWADNETSGAFRGPSASLVQYGDVVGVAWVEGAAAPYNVRYKPLMLIGAALKTAKAL